MVMGICTAWARPLPRRSIEDADPTLEAKRYPASIPTFDERTTVMVERC
jgi:hypothetical protein